MSTPRTGRTTTNTTGAYNANFEQKLIDHGIYPYSYEYPDGQAPPKPDNWEEINQILAQPRPSLSPFPDEQFKKFVRADARATNEDEVKDSVIPKLLDTIGDPNGARRNIRFTNLARLSDLGEDGLEGEDEPEKKDKFKLAQPDYYYGTPPELLNLDIRAELSNDIVPSTTATLPIVPNYFIEAKGPDGSSAVVTRQACFDGAHGARAMHSLRLYGKDEPVYDNNAYTLSGIYHAGQLKMFSHYTAQPNGVGTRPEYYMHQLDAWAMTGNKRSYVQGLTALKNAEDWTKKVRDTVIARANEMAGRTTADDEEEEEIENEEEETVNEEAEPPSATPSLVYGTTPTLSSLTDKKNSGSDTSTDELQRDFYPPAKRSSSNPYYSPLGKRKANSRRTS